MSRETRETRVIVDRNAFEENLSGMDIFPFTIESDFFYDKKGNLYVETHVQVTDGMEVAGRIIFKKGSRAYADALRWAGDPDWSKYWPKSAGPCPDYGW